MQPQTTGTSAESRSELMKDIEDIFADPEYWLNTPNLRLAGRKPIDLIGTPDEVLVRNVIGSIKYGLFS